VIGAAEVIRCIEDGELYLEGLYVRPRFQGKGYGGHLLRRVTGAVRQQGFNRIRATVDPQNIPGLSLYWQAGFKQIGNLVDHYGPGKHRLLLSLDLEATDDDR
jgi:ribosomal-protein-alanine N-acetyltransferase